MEDALWLAGRARRVKDEERVLRIDPFDVALRIRSADGVVPPDVTPLRHVDRKRLVREALKDNRRLDVCKLGRVGDDVE